SYTFVNVTADHTITATFALNRYALDVAIVGLGNVTRVPSQTTYLHGDVVMLMAIPASGWYFGQWSGAASGALTQTTVTMNAHQVVTATFLNTPPTYYTLTMHLVGSGVVTPGVGARAYLAGTQADLSATPTGGWTFAGWTGDVTGSVNPAALTMDGHKAVTATFALNTYVITPTAGADGSITPGTPQTVAHGGSQAFTIAANTGYHIVDVGVDGVSQGALASYTFVNVTADHTITATFARNAVARNIYLPLILRQLPPDLIVRSVTVSPAGLLVNQPATITIVIENIGGLPTAGPFWVDLYIDPDATLMPPQVNQTWDVVGSQYGLAWWVTQSLAPGEQITLTSLAYAADYSDWPGYFNCFGPHILYAQVDSYSSTTTYGGIWEADETNNVYGPVSVPVMCPAGRQQVCPAPQIRSNVLRRP
ncbi:MAG TPA: CARDB domain-containing protein, partial [Anaerolineae bacterium]|nr:CARDB domain-containing protein [Anaerolineae bacterium]